MANEVLVKVGTPVVWADVTDYSPTNSGLTRTLQMNMENVANNAAWQGAKGDFGATRAAEYEVFVAMVPNATPTAGLAWEFYWSSSPSGTAGTGNAGGASGTDAAYQAGNEDAFAKQLIPLGMLVTTASANTVVQMQSLGRFRPPNRYGSPVMVNKSGQTTKTTPATDLLFALIPIVDEIQ